MTQQRKLRPLIYVKYYGQWDGRGNSVNIPLETELAIVANEYLAKVDEIYLDGSVKLIVHRIGRPNVVLEGQEYRKYVFQGKEHERITLNGVRYSEKPKCGYWSW